MKVKMFDAFVTLMLVATMTCCIGRDDDVNHLPTVGTVQVVVDSTPGDPLNSPPSGMLVVNRFYALVSEYFRTVVNHDGNAKAKYERENLINFFTWCCLRDYYLNKLTLDDKSWMFANLNTSCTLPVGIAFDHCGPVSGVVGMEPTGNPRADFEDFLLNSFPDTNYQTGFDVSREAKAVKAIHQTVRSRMKSLGIEYPNDLSQAERLLSSE